VTLAGRQEYTESSINNIGHLVISLVSMARAHEESHMKSIRARVCWKEKVANANTRSLPASVRTGSDIMRKHIYFDLIEERAELIREIYRKVIAGMGQGGIVKELNERKVPSWGRANGWHETYLQKLSP